MAHDSKSKTSKEVVGIFIETDALEKALDELQTSGFGRTQLGLLADDKTVSQRLGPLFRRVQSPEGDRDDPPTDWIREQSTGDAVHGLLGGLIFGGAATAAGALIAIVGVFGGAILTAGVGAAAVGGLGAVLATIISKDDAEYLQEQIDRGRVLLLVRTADPAEEETAIEILSRCSPVEPRVYDINPSRTENG